MGELERNLRQTFGKDTPRDPMRGTGGDDLFGFNNGFKPAEKLTDAELQRREAFMKIYDFNNSRPADVVPGSGGFSTRYVDSSFYDPPKLLMPAPTPTAALGGGLSGGALRPSGTAAWMPPTPPPALKPLPAPAPVSPFVSIPRRSF